MEQITINELMHDGMRRLEIISDMRMNLTSSRWACLVPKAARPRIVLSESHNQVLGIHAMQLTWPVYEPFAIAIESPKRFRRMMLVHYSYAERVSDCIKLAADAFMEGTHTFPKYAWVREIPTGAEDWIDVHGVELIMSEIAPRNCVLVGGVQ